VGVRITGQRRIKISLKSLVKRRRAEYEIGSSVRQPIQQSEELAVRLGTHLAIRGLGRSVYQFTNYTYSAIY